MPTIHIAETCSYNSSIIYCKCTMNYYLFVLFHHIDVFIRRLNSYSLFFFMPIYSTQTLLARSKKLKSPSSFTIHEAIFLGRLNVLYFPCCQPCWNLCERNCAPYINISNFLTLSVQLQPSHCSIKYFFLMRFAFSRSLYK